MRVRLTVRRLMVVVLFSAFCLAAFRYHPSLGFLISAIACLTLIRTFGAIDQAAVDRSGNVPIENDPGDSRLHDCRFDNPGCFFTPRSHFCWVA